MNQTEWIEAEVRKVWPDAQVECPISTTPGTTSMCAISPSFEGMRPLKRQKPILDHFKPHIASGVVHALHLRCMTPRSGRDSR